MDKRSSCRWFGPAWRSCGVTLRCQNLHHFPSTYTNIWKQNIPCTILPRPYSLSLTLRIQSTHILTQYLAFSARPTWQLKWYIRLRSWLTCFYGRGVPSIPLAGIHMDTSVRCLVVMNYVLPWTAIPWNKALFHKAIVHFRYIVSRNETSRDSLYCTAMNNAFLQSASLSCPEIWIPWEDKFCMTKSCLVYFHQMSLWQKTMAMWNWNISFYNDW